MRTTLGWVAGLFCVLAVTATSGRAEDDPPADDDVGQVGKGLKVEFDAASPTSFNKGEVKASGSVTIQKGWKCDTVVIRAFDSNNAVAGKAQSDNPNPNWSGTIDKLPPGTYVILATGYFTDGKVAKQVDSNPATIVVK